MAPAIEVRGLVKSYGDASNAISLAEPVMRMTVSASSSMVNS